MDGVRKLSETSRLQQKDIEDAEKNVERISNILELIEEKSVKPPKKKPAFVKNILGLEKQFIGHMEDDINTPHAFAAFWQLISLVNKKIDENVYSKKIWKLQKKP